MSNALKEAFALYKQRKAEEKKYKQLLLQKMDYNFLQYLIDLAPEKDIIIDVELADHTKLVIKKDKRKTNQPVFSGD